MEKALIIGSSGLLGKHLCIFLKKKFIVTRFERSKKKNFLNNKFCHTFFNKKKFNVIVFLNAITDIDYCEKNKKEALNVNYKIVKNVVNCSNSLNLSTFFLFISTDQFYNKFKKNNEKNNKIFNFYAKTKLLTEIYLQNKNSCILRTNFFGRSLNKLRFSFSDFIINNLKKNKKIYLTDDILFSPVSIKYLCKIICLLCVKKITGKYNLGSRGGFSKYKFGLLLAKQLKLNTKQIEKTSYKELNFSARRPKDMRMKLGKLNKKLKIKSVTLVDEIKKVIHEYK
jgi:dTDP-4-dehydrorhamnose reductase